MTSQNTSSKSGAALLVALGFLALLTIMIIAFSAQTRTDRQAGRAYLTTAQTRQLLQAALARALEDIDASVGTNYPDFLAIGSPPAKSGDSYLAGSVDFSTEQDYYASGNLALSNAFLAALDSAQWQSVPATGSKAVGRVGYLVLNTSGLLDANSVGSHEMVDGIPVFRERNSGTSPAEIQLSPDTLTELATGSFPLFQTNGTSIAHPDPGLAFVYNRTNSWRRFETLRDVKILNQRGGANIIDLPIESFSTFSLFPSDATPRMDLSGNVDPVEFKRILTAHCGLDADEANAVYENYLDYIDPDDIPQNLRGSSPEAVPMINEIWIDNFLFEHTAQDATNVSYALSGEIHIETWYPFAGTPPTNHVQLFAGDPETLSTNAVEILQGEDNIGANDYVTIDVVYTNGIVKSMILEAVPITIKTSDNGTFTTYSHEFSLDEDYELDIPLQGTDTDFVPISIRIKQESIEIGNLDRVENTELEFTFSESGLLENQYASCFDPRVNHDFSDLQLWTIDAVNTPNAINAIENWGEEADLADKNDIRFYVRNSPIENAAELGNLSLGKPWRTIQLCSGDTPLHPVLDHFDAAEALWDKTKRPGLVNLNSRHANAIASAFLDAPIRIDPENNEPIERVSGEQALAIGRNLAALAQDNPQHSLSHVGNAVSNNIPDWETLTDVQRESIVANSYRLFGWRDTHFTIFAVAQSGTDFNADGIISDDEARGTQQAVIYVWRDPVTGQTACVFYGLSDTLQSSIGSGKTWNSLLRDFEP